MINLLFKILAVVVFLFALGCLGMTRLGDDDDMRALAAIFYYPALAFAVLDLCLWAIVLAL